MGVQVAPLFFIGSRQSIMYVRPKVLEVAYSGQAIWGLSRDKCQRDPQTKTILGLIGF